MKLKNQNAGWFGRPNAFSYLNIDRDNILRIKKIERYLSRYAKSRQKKFSLLDVGCGDGYIGQKLSKIGYDVYGLDLSKKLVGLAEKSGVKAKVGDASKNFPFKNNFFDVVFAGEIIEHLFDTRAFLNEIYRVLRPKGLFVVTTPNLVHLPDRISFLIGKSPLQINPLHEHLNLHIRPFTYETLSAALKSCKFNVNKLESTLVVFSRDPKDPEQVTLSSKLLADLFPTLGSFLIVYAKKK